MLRLNVVYFILVYLLAASCANSSYSPDGMKKLSDEALIEMARNHQFPSLENVTFKLEDGSEVDMEDLKNNYDEDAWAMDYYIDKDSVMREMIVRPIKPSDLELRDRLMEAIEEGPELEIKQIFCENKKDILQAVFDRDQAMRGEGNQIDPAVDRDNLATVISLLEQCGMPTKEEVGEIPMTAIWLVFQHSSKTYRKKYFSHLKEAALKGDLDQGTIAMMEDRILMDDDKPQIYGSQIKRNEQTGKWELYTLENPETVDQRRSEVGMGPLADYLSRWDITFNIPQSR